jgi:hypothetical protein
VTAAPPRSKTLTAVAWAIVLASTVGLAISFISLLMILSGGQGTSSGDVFGFLIVVVAPPVTLFAGMNLLRRKRWAYLYMLALLSAVLVFNGYDFLTASTVEKTYVSPSGVLTTELPTPRSMYVPAIVISAGMLLMLLSRGVRAEFPASDASQAASTEQTQAGASPSSGRADESVAGSRSALRAPESVYDRAALEASAPSPSSQRLAVLLIVALLLGLAGTMGWLVTDGIATGKTTLPIKHVQRSVSRADEPAMFWLSIGSYAVVGAGALGLVVWGFAQSRRRTSGRPRHI